MPHEARKVGVAGVRKMMECPMAGDGIDEVTGKVDVYKLCPEKGDSIMIVNCGTHYEVRHHHWDLPPLLLTDEDIERLRRGQITWN